jgi:hypothetical protein
MLGKNYILRPFKTGVLRSVFGTQRMDSQEDGENCNTRNLIISAVHKIFSE